ncbi:MAG TPA: hypothetical protein VLX92_21605 [Kofleriaceae bacterium]|nr:hypothetical protein [Kofleriaceae bacterium]
MTPLDNDPGGDVQDAVTDALDNGDLAIVGPKQVSRTVDKLGLDSGELSDKDLKKLANELDADAVVAGTLSSKGGNKVLHFKLVVHGKKQKGFKIEFGSAKSSKFKHALHDKMMEKLGDLGSGDVADKPDKRKKKTVASADDDSDSKPARKKKKHDKASDDAGSGDDDADAKPARKKKKDKVAADADDKSDSDDKPATKAGDDDSAGGDSDDKPAKKGGDDDSAAGGDGDDAPHKAKPERTAHAGDDDASAEVHAGVAVDAGSARAANHAAVRVDLGPSVTARSLRFNSRDFAEAPKNYTNKIVPGGRVEGEVYPLAIGNPYGLASGIGVGGYYDRTLSLNVTNSEQTNTKFPVTEQHWQAGLRYRLVFGRSDTAISATLGFDYGHQTFKINRAGLMPGLVIDIPDVDYAGYIPQLVFRIPLARSIAVVVGGGTTLVTKAGEIQQNSSYGQAKVTTGQGVVGLDIVFLKRFAVQLQGDLEQVGLAFKYTGEESIDRDGNPATKDVGGATDRYYGGALLFSVMY